MTAPDLDRLEALLDAATAAPWEATLRDAPRDDTFVYAIDGDQAVADVDAPADAALIVELRNAAPALIAAARAARVQRERYVQATRALAISRDLVQQTRAERDLARGTLARVLSDDTMWRMAQAMDKYPALSHARAAMNAVLDVAGEGPEGDRD